MWQQMHVPLKSRQHFKINIENAKDFRIYLKIKGVMKFNVPHSCHSPTALMSGETLTQCPNSWSNKGEN